MAREIFAQSDELLGFPLSHLAWKGPLEALNETINTQPALLVHSVAALRVFEERFPGFHPAFVAGHSMGELSALVASRSLPFPEALRLVRLRGELMKSAGDRSPGGMAAILGLNIDVIESICQKVSVEGDRVQIANDNCPGQAVISGSQPALERAMQLANKSGARRTIPLAVSIAAHSYLMESAQNEFSRAILAAPIEDPEIAIIGNVTAEPLRSAAQIRADLQAQLNSRVRWTESIHFLLKQGVNTFLEIGTGSVLTGLLKRIGGDAIGIPLGEPHDFERLLS